MDDVIHQMREVENVGRTRKAWHAESANIHSEFSRPIAIIVYYLNVNLFFPLAEKALAKHLHCDDTFAMKLNLSLGLQPTMKPSRQLSTVLVR